MGGLAWQRHVRSGLLVFCFVVRLGLEMSFSWFESEVVVGQFDIAEDV